MDAAYLLKLNELGRKRANPYAYHTNTMKFAKGQGACCGVDTTPTCQHKLTIPSASEVVIGGIVFNDEVIDVRQELRTPFPQDIEQGVYNTNTQKLHAPIPTGIIASDVDKFKQYLFIVCTRFELDPFIKVVYDTDEDEVTVEHIGQCVFSGVKPINGTALDATIAATECCTIAQINKYRLFLVGETGDAYNGNDTAALANTPYEYAGDATTDSATAAQLKTDIEAALTTLAVDYKEVSVFVENTAMAFQVDIKVFGANSDFGVGAKQAVYCASLEEFNCM
jgi:hypothetical protein